MSTHHLIAARALLPDGHYHVDQRSLLWPSHRRPGEGAAILPMHLYLVVARVFGLRQLMPLGPVSISAVYAPEADMNPALGPDPALGRVIVEDCNIPVLVVDLLEWREKISAWLDANDAKIRCARCDLPVCICAPDASINNRLAAALFKPGVGVISIQRKDDGFCVVYMDKDGQKQTRYMTDGRPCPQRSR